MWDNHDQSYSQQVGGCYVWSLKINKNVKLKVSYQFMREIAPGSVMVSFADTLMKAACIATSPYYDYTKPRGFGAAGKVWGPPS